MQVDSEVPEADDDIHTTTCTTMSARSIEADSDPVPPGTVSDRSSRIETDGDALVETVSDRTRHIKADDDVSTTSCTTISARRIEADGDHVPTRAVSDRLPRIEADGDVPAEAAAWASHILSQMNHLRNQGERCDTVITSSSGTVFPAHSVILAASSDKLHTAFARDTELEYVLHLPADDSTVKNLLDFLYTGKISCEFTNISSTIVFR